MSIFLPEFRQILIHWISERERIRHVKESGKMVKLTLDPILAEWGDEVSCPDRQGD